MRIWIDDDNHYLLLPYHEATVVSGHASTNYGSVIVACVQKNPRMWLVPQYSFADKDKANNFFVEVFFLGKRELVVVQSPIGLITYINLNVFDHIALL